ncbi:unnamed protein product (mitochondrion) [Plasmodiophora brassicae]|uniref:Uncharacterized protein n=1 Tax=Plasmodiophora brassicae TaxID=37360 RepID=A0A3P3YFW9_PLABS|nr:unnamed protein product [Plasmodiophora brassicae]
MGRVLGDEVGRVMQSVSQPHEECLITLKPALGRLGTPGPNVQSLRFVMPSLPRPVISAVEPSSAQPPSRTRDHVVVGIASLPARFGTARYLKQHIEVHHRNAPTINSKGKRTPPSTVHFANSHLRTHQTGALRVRSLSQIFRPFVRRSSDGFKSSRSREQRRSRRFT